MRTTRWLTTLALMGALSLNLSACGGSSEENDPIEADAGWLEPDAGPVEDDAGEPDAGPAEIDPTQPSAASEAALKKMLPIAEYMMEGQWVDGMVVAAVTPDGMSVRGLGSLADSAAPENETFEIASITKIFVGMALASMTNDGIVSPDTKLTDCMPDGYSTEGIEDITLGMLATHSAGFGHDQDNIRDIAEAVGGEDYLESDIFSYVSVDDIWNSLTLTSRTRVGQEQYSNYGVAVLGHALAVCDHEASWKDVIQKRVTGVLGLGHTGIDVPLTTQGYDKSLTALAPWTWTLDGLGPCGGFKSNVTDLGRLAQLVMSQESYPGSDMVNLSVQPLKPYSEEYGMNWMLGDSMMESVMEREETKALFRKMIWHGGVSDTYGTYLGISRDKNVAVILLNNSSSITAQIPGAFSMARQMGESPESIQENLEWYLPPVAELTEEKLKKFEGTYKISGMAPWPVTLTVENGLDGQLQLWADQPGYYGRFRLWPQTEQIAVFRYAFASYFEFNSTDEDHFQKGEFYDALTGQYLTVIRAQE